MADIYIVTSSDLTSVADAIRTKTNATEHLTFPSGFSTAINNIQTAPTEPYVEEIFSSDDSFGKLISAVFHGGVRVRANMFYNSTYLTSVTLPSKGLKYIDNSAFKGCTSLPSIDIPNGIWTIGNEAFCDCTNLTMTELPAGLMSIGGYAFANCPNITMSYLPPSMTTIFAGAFKNCTGLTTMTFASKVTSIGSEMPSNVFEGCTNLTTINVPWAEGAIANAPWGATNATINYNYTKTN